MASYHEGITANKGGLRAKVASDYKGLSIRSMAQTMGIHASINQQQPRFPLPHRLPALCPLPSLHYPIHSHP